MYKMQKEYNLNLV